MIKASPLLKELLQEFRNQRKNMHIEDSDIERKLILGPGWLEDIENGKVSISMEMFFALLNASDISLSSISSNLNQSNTQEVPRNVVAEQSGKNLKIYFKYAKHDAVYILINATKKQFDDVVKTLRDGLSRLVTVNDDDSKEKAIKTEAVASAFKKAVNHWPTANPSDIWWFIIYRAYLDPFNHPSIYSRLTLEQSWKRTGGWALEEIVVRHYSTALKNKGINIFIAPKNKREALLSQADVSHRLEGDKVDIFLTGNKDGKEVFFGVVHVKASFAERRTDDVPMSKALVDAGYVSPLWTMDCKSTPKMRPENKGELGEVLIEGYTATICQDNILSVHLPTAWL